MERIKEIALDIKVVVRQLKDESEKPGGGSKLAIARLEKQLRLLQAEEKALKPWNQHKRAEQVDIVVVMRPRLG